MIYFLCGKKIKFKIKKNSIANKVIEGSEFKNIDFRMLRSFRVLRPLKLVSRTPSKYIEYSETENVTTIHKQNLN